MNQMSRNERTEIFVLGHAVSLDSFRGGLPNLPSYSAVCVLFLLAVQSQIDRSVNRGGIDFRVNYFYRTRATTKAKYERHLPLTTLERPLSLIPPIADFHRTSARKRNGRQRLSHASEQNRAGKRANEDVGRTETDRGRIERHSAESRDHPPAA